MLEWRLACVLIKKVLRSEAPIGLEIGLPRSSYLRLREPLCELASEGLRACEEIEELSLIDELKPQILCLAVELDEWCEGDLPLGKPLLPIVYAIARLTLVTRIGVLSDLDPRSEDELPKASVRMPQSLKWLIGASPYAHDRGLKEAEGRVECYRLAIGEVRARANG